jgi:hypothetical protein
MSKTTQNTASGTPVAERTDKKPDMTEAAQEWALTVALQKTEWHALKGVTTRLLTLKDTKSGKKFVAAVWAIPTDELTADNDKFTFFVNGENVDDIVARLAERATE